MAGERIGDLADISSYQLPDVGPPLIPLGVPAADPFAEAWRGLNQPRPEGQTLYQTKAGPITEGDIGRASDIAMGFSGGGLGIKAYHGSPHSFEKFDLSKIGTGEGAQVYGHGLYFAEAEPVAKAYRERLSAARSLPPDVLAQYYQPGQIVKSYGGGFDLVKRFDPTTGAVTVRSVDKAGNPTQDLLGLRDRVHTTPPTIAEVNSAFRERGLPEYRPGHMYQVDINADPQAFLNWDKQLREQSPSVQKAVEPYIEKDLQTMRRSNLSGQEINDWRDALQNRTMTGRQLYNTQLDRVKTSQELQAAGVPGIQYADAGSRAQRPIVAATNTVFGNVPILGDYIKPKPTHNYVVFDPSIVQIMKKYGIVGAPAGTMGALAAQDQYQMGE